ncbi:aminotransferase class I/II-fold pyridoxal phosphate-dependent enzyme [Acetobacter orleanensis]|uniref:8-amino-7-oxononanoate synthase n=1 Tax=Acetobacter orleanensis TaxID=104099 RepID=A0A4Y3TJS5_9PROT|nr:8-amino-7-oxononanoate synthase [Acetobacter orleanensis]KXV62243.1 8-amino-7-oxononanoate synthase [Acetobacter orleanensis]PCD80722.1 8-amino-7-oxononanoate synthase [Acetobacter orleanensis]GAN68863.1 alpha-oxoamine synthase/8-amino-7-oxononanoate synthase [Acetobacter orleanensis JCM 7639]GBR30921.1 8-amino-7-oxononanoate synthase [Acetobacter orleanensis NRIC 0473]GEB81729.1 8-amino-7-ketopelargonate synthase [Acetobacter orleanensis]
MTRFDHLFQHGLEELAEQGRLRTPRSLQPRADGLLEREDGTVLVDFSSNDYLGLRAHPLLRERALAWAERYGAGSGASRLVTGTAPGTVALEARLAALKGMEAACIFSSGWQANATLVPALAQISLSATGAPPTLLVDKFIHASLYHGCAAAGVRPVRFRHNDMAHLEHLLQSIDSPGLKIILTESVFSMDGDRADMVALGALARQYNALLCVDEAHATGILGADGKGLADGQADLIIGTFSKALGGMGAFVASSAALCRWLVNKGSGYIYSTAPSPLVLGAVEAALDLLPQMEATRQHVASLAERFRQHMRCAGLETGASSTQIVPVVVGSEHTALTLSRKVEAAGFLAIAIRPPTVPPGGCRLRVVLHGNHTEAQVDQLATILRTAVTESAAGALL